MFIERKIDIEMKFNRSYCKQDNFVDRFIGFWLRLIGSQ